MNWIIRRSKLFCEVVFLKNREFVLRGFLHDGYLYTETKKYWLTGNERIRIVWIDKPKWVSVGLMERCVKLVGCNNGKKAL